MNLRNAIVLVVTGISIVLDDDAYVVEGNPILHHVGGKKDSFKKIKNDLSPKNALIFCKISCHFQTTEKILRKACWVDGNKKNRQCIWSTLLECVDITEGSPGALC